MSKKHKRDTRERGTGFVESFEKDSLHEFSNTYRGIIARFGHDSEEQSDTCINEFIENYQQLPLAARAKLENWSINAEDIALIPSDIADSGAMHATYRGLKVSATVHKEGLDQARDGEFLHNELRAMAQVRHPNIVGFLGASLSSKRCIVLTELMSGTLRSFYLSKQARQPAWRPTSSEAMAWALDLARAVTYLHHSDPAVIHRDLRPETLLIASSGALKVSGFGHCRMLAASASRTAPAADRSSEPSPSRAALPAAAPTPRGPPSPRACAAAAAAPAPDGGPYVAPELRRDAACADASVDMFAAAMVMRFLRTGRDPPPHTPALPAARAPVRCGGGGRAGRSGPGHGAGGGAGCLGWGAAGRLVAQAWAEEAGARPGAEALAEALEAEAGRRSACRLA